MSEMDATRARIHLAALDAKLQSADRLGMAHSKAISLAVCIPDIEAKVICTTQLEVERAARILKDPYWNFAFEARWNDEEDRLEFPHGAKGDSIVTIWFEDKRQVVI